MSAVSNAQFFGRSLARLMFFIDERNDGDGACISSRGQDPPDSSPYLRQCSRKGTHAVMSVVPVPVYSVLTLDVRSIAK